MQITKSDPEGVPTLTIQGQLDGTTSPQLEGELLSLTQARSTHLILDLAQVPLVSSAALRVLLSAAKRMKKHGGRIGLCALRPEVRQVFDISGLTALFSINPGLDEALAAARGTPAEPPPAKLPAVEPIQVAPPAPPAPVASATPPPPAPPEPPPTSAPRANPPAPVPATPPEDDPGATMAFRPLREPESDPGATMTFRSTRESESDPGATMIFSSKPAPAKTRPDGAERQPAAHPEPAAPPSPSLTAATPPPVAEKPPAPSAAREPVTPSTHGASAPPPAAPPRPPPPVPPPVPPAVSPDAEPLPSATVIPTTPLRRTPPAVLAKAAELRGDPPPPPPPAPTAGAPTRSPSRFAPLGVVPPVPSVQTQGDEPFDDPPYTPARPLLPIIAAATAVLLVLFGLGSYLRSGKKEKQAKPDRSASSPSAVTPRPAHSPAVTPSPEATAAPTPTATIAVPTPSPSASSTPSPTAVPAATPTATPAIAQATPAPLQTPEATPLASQTPEVTPAETIMTAAGAIDTNRSSPENQAIRQAVMQRIDAMPLSPADKARLYTALERARGLGKLVTINFATGRTDLAPNDVVSLDHTLHRPKVQRFLDDPAVVLVVLGFSDTKGNEKTNKEISERRARRVVEALRGPCNVGNMIHSVGMGGQTIAGESLDKNRVVEIWAVLP